MTVANPLPCRRRPARRGFTLIELLVVIAIIALLVSILVPSLQRVRKLGRAVVCMTNLRSMHVGLAIYISENNGYLAGINMPGFHGPPDAGQTTYYLEMQRTFGASLSSFPDSVAVWNDQRGWIEMSRVQLCPEDHEWGAWNAYGSYAPDRPCWEYYVKDHGGSLYYPTRTQLYQFTNVRMPGQSVMLSEILHHAGFGIMDNTTQTANCWDPAYSAGGWLSARHLHPGAGIILADSGGFYWEGTNSYLFFDGHVAARQYPPYKYGTVNPEGANLPTYADMVD